MKQKYLFIFFLSFTNYNLSCLRFFQILLSNKNEDSFDIVNSVDSGNLHRVKELIISKISPNSKAPSGWTILQIAAFKGHTKIVQYLLDVGADPLLRNKQGLTAYQVSKNNAIRDMIFDKMVELHDIRKILYNAIELNDINLLKTSMKKTSLHIYNSNGNTPLHLAAKYKNKELFYLILLYNPGLISITNFENKTPLDIWPEIAIYLSLKAIENKEL